MSDEINFIDLAVLLKITPNTTLEKLGGIMNAGIFDASNIAGSLKQKGLIEFSAYYPGPNSISITETGKNLIADADSRSSESFDELDDHILRQLSGGSRIPIELQTTLNIRPKDLAMRLYKENKQGFIIYDLKNGGVELMLTEKGFLQAKSGQAQTPMINTASVASTTQQMVQRQAVQQGPIPQQTVAPAQPTSPQPVPEAPANAPAKPQMKSMKKWWMIFAVLAVLFIILAYATGRLP